MSPVVQRWVRAARSTEAQAWLLGVLFVVAVVVRTWRFGEIPAGLNQDEGSLGYDAWSLLHYGIERNGFRFPVVLPAYGSGMSGTLAAYLAMPFVALFGLTVPATRAVNLLFGLASLPMFFWLVRSMAGARTALVAFFLLAINPWHIAMSRWGLDCNLFPALFLLATCLLAAAEKRRRLLSWSAAVYALSLYSYGTSHVVVPVFLLLTLGYLLWHGRLRGRDIVAPGAVFALLALPALGYVLINRFQLHSLETPFFTIPRLPSEPEFRSVSSIFGSSALGSVPANLAVLWKLLVTQYDGILWNVFPDFGFLYLFSLPLMGLGLLLLVSETWDLRSFHPSFSMTAWMLASVALACVLPLNVNRGNILMLPLVFAVALALDFLWQKRLVFSVLVAMYVAAFGSFVHAYFTVYPDQVGVYFHESLGPAIQIAAAQTDGTICITSRANMPEVPVMFFLKPDPGEFTRTVEYVNPGAMFQKARSFGRFVFGLENCTGRAIGAYVLQNSEAAAVPAVGYRTIRLKNYLAAIPAGAPTPSP